MNTQVNEDKYLRIVSEGEIDELAFTLLGGTTKRGDAQKIGMFGSGLKYAISSLIRNNINFQVYSGTKKLDFGLVETKFRDNSFNVITINGKETSLTTNMGGSDWDNAFAPIREIYSNALDEDEATILDISSDFGGFELMTTFYIELTSDIREFYNNKDLFFLNKKLKPVFFTEKGAVYKNTLEDKRIFRNGILCERREGLKAHYIYNSSLFEINESRVLKNTYSTEKIIVDMWKTTPNYQELVSFIHKIRRANTGSYEAEFDWNRYSWMSSPTQYSDAWLKLIQNYKFVAMEHLDLFEQDELSGRIELKFELLKSLTKQFGNEIDVLGVTSESEDGITIDAKPDQFLLDKVVDAIEVLRETNYKSRFDKLDIKYVKFSNKNVKAEAKNEQILLSVTLTDMTVDEIAMILIEENEHLKTGYEDETRQFQNHLFRLYFNQLIR